MEEGNLLVDPKASLGVMTLWGLTDFRAKGRKKKGYICLLICNISILMYISYNKDDIKQYDFLFSTLAMSLRYIKECTSVYNYKSNLP